MWTIQKFQKTRNPISFLHVSVSKQADCQTNFNKKNNIQIEEKTIKANLKQDEA